MHSFLNKCTCSKLWPISSAPAYSIPTSQGLLTLPQLLCGSCRRGHRFSYEYKHALILNIVPPLFFLSFFFFFQYAKFTQWQSPKTETWLPDWEVTPILLDSTARFVSSGRSSITCPRLRQTGLVALYGHRTPPAFVISSRRSCLETCKYSTSRK